MSERSLLSKAESSYIHTSLLAKRRLDGRDLHDFRSVALETGVSPLANGSAKVKLGGTQVLAATKLEVQAVGDDEDGIDGGNIVCNVTCSPAAYPHYTPTSLDDYSADLTSILHTTLSDKSLHPKNLGKLLLVPTLDLKRAAHRRYHLREKKLVPLSRCGGPFGRGKGNVVDAIFIAAKAALWDTKVPRTRSIAYRASKNKDLMDIDQPQSGLDTRTQNKASVAGDSRGAEFELPDYWDEGEVLDGRDQWPVSVTLNVVNPMTSKPSESICYLDAVSEEEATTQTRLVLIFSFLGSGKSYLQGTRLLGATELISQQLGELVKEGQKHGQALCGALTMKLQEEDVRRGIKTRERFESSRVS